VSYARVSTPEQAERDLSLPAQRHDIAAYAARHGAHIAREYVEAWGKGRNPRRPELRRMIGDALAADSDIGVIVVAHTSRFMRDAAEARMLKKALRKHGVRVLYVSQEIQDDPMGKFIEGVFELVDEYESEINGMRTAAAMAEAVRQGFYPSGKPPFGYARERVELRPGVVRYRLVPDPNEAPIVREVFELYIAKNGAKAVARELTGADIGIATDRGARTASFTCL
jgi:DNA invertase Pin-like site-specific DNA recombinase